MYFMKKYKINHSYTFTKTQSNYSRRLTFCFWTVEYFHNNESAALKAMYCRIQKLAYLTPPKRGAYCLTATDLAHVYVEDSVWMSSKPKVFHLHPLHWKTTFVGTDDGKLAAMMMSQEEVPQHVGCCSRWCCSTCAFAPIPATPLCFQCHSERKL